MVHKLTTKLLDRAEAVDSKDQDWKKEWIDDGHTRKGNQDDFGDNGHTNYERDDEKEIFSIFDFNSLK